MELSEDLEFVAKVHHTAAALRRRHDGRTQSILYTALANQSPSMRVALTIPRVYIARIQECYDNLEMSSEAKDKLRERLALLMG